MADDVDQVIGAALALLAVEDPVGSEIGFGAVSCVSRSTAGW